MGSAGLTPADFKRLPKDGARFEALVCQLLEAMGYRILEKPAVGTEGGRDVLVERTIKDAMVERREKVVVQCKHYAHSGRAIGDKQVGVWQNAMARYKTRGYLLATDTRVTENLSRSFREFTEDEANYPRWAAFWDVDELITHLNKYPEVRDSFFPPDTTMKRTPLEDLAAEVRTWLQAIRYKLDEPQRLDDRSMSMVAVMDEGTVKQRVLVRCIGGEIMPGDVDALDKMLDRKTPQGWLISDKRVSDRARERAAEDDAFQVFTLADFLRQMVWGPYFEALTSLVEKDQIPDLYVDLGCYKQEMSEEGLEVGRDQYPSLDAYIDDWLTERGKMHISLLGEFGTGKTWFCRHYAYRQLGRYLEDPANERLPLLITLRAFAKAMTAQQLINDALLEQYKLPFVGSAFQVFQEMNRRGKLLLILDGFDEMARQVDYQTVVDNFWELAELVDEGSKVILTSRAEYFRWAKESEKVLGGEEFGRRTIVLSPPKFEVLHLESFSDDQIREVITRRLGAEEGPAVAERILETENLAEMARKPVLIELLLAALEEVSADVLESPAQVYLYATNRLLLRNIDTKRTFTTTADKLYFLCELAWEMIKSGELRIHYTDIPERIKAYFGDRIKDQHELDTWDYDLRNQTLLHRDAAGYYEFAHKSLAEYFVAFKFAAELGCLAPAFAQTYCEADGQPCQVPIGQKDITGLVETFGAISLTDEQMRAVRELLQEMMAEDAAERLWKVIDETRGRTPEQVKYAGGNAATLLRMRDESFKGAILAQTVLAGANLHGTDLTRTDLQGACLRGVDLSDCRLRNTDLRRAQLFDVEIGWMGVVSLTWSPNGQFLAAGFHNGGVAIWNIDTIASEFFNLHWFYPVSSLAYGLAISPENVLLAVGGMDSSISFWDIYSARLVRSFELLEAHYQPTFDICYHPFGQQIAICQYESPVIILDTQLYREVTQLHGYRDSVHSIRYSPDGTYVAAAGYDNVVRLWEMPCGSSSIQLIGHEDSVRTVRFAPDGNMLVSCGDDETIRLWDLKSRQQRAVLKQHDGWVFGLDVSPDGNLIASGGDDTSVLVWRRDGSLLCTLTGHKSYVRNVAFHPNRPLLASGSWDSAVRIWDIAPDSPTFGQCLKVLGTSYCQGMQISGAQGLQETWRSQWREQGSTLLEFFADHGAVLDEEQERVLAEARKRRENGVQRK